MADTEDETTIHEVRELTRSLTRAFSVVQREWVSANEKSPNWALHTAVWLFGALIARTFDAPGNALDEESRSALNDMLDSMGLETSNDRNAVSQTPKARA